MYSAVSGLNCGTWDLLLWPTVSLAAVYGLTALQHLRS